MQGQLEGVRVMPIHASIAAVLGRRADRGGTGVAVGPEVDLSPDWWFSTMLLSMAAEAAMYVGEAGIAATAYDRLLRFSGMPACSGSGTVIGPVDAFLAMAAQGNGSAGPRHPARGRGRPAVRQVGDPAGPRGSPGSGRPTASRRRAGRHAPRVARTGHAWPATPA